MILDGEELVGAKQNRIVNVTILVPPEKEIVIPVTCVEAGRWTYTHSRFASSGHVLNHTIRSRKAEAVTRNLKARKVRFSDQNAVWADVSETLDAVAATSHTKALNDAFNTRRVAIDEILRNLQPQPQQIGMIYRVGKCVIGLDLLGSVKAFGLAFPKLVRGLALQALAGTELDSDTTLGEQPFLRAMLIADVERFPAVGMGEELRIEGKEVGAAALALDGELVHAFAFSRKASGGRGAGSRPYSRG